MVDSLAKEVEKEKMKAIGARNLLKSVAKHREAERQQLQVRWIADGQKMIPQAPY
jgi:intraflagellar transport protein 20